MNIHTNTREFIYALVLFYTGSKLFYSGIDLLRLEDTPIYPILYIIIGFLLIVGGLITINNNLSK